MRAQSWQFMRVRPDKDTPNFVTTYESVLRSIDDNITQKHLLAAINSFEENKQENKQ